MCGSIAESTLKIPHYPVMDFSNLAIAMSTGTSEGEILTIKQVAGRTTYRLPAAKKIPAFKVVGRWRFRKADIDRWIAAQSHDVRGQAG